MGAEAVATFVASAIAFITWSHQQRQRIVDSRFTSYKEKIEKIEDRINDMPLKYVLKVDLELQLEDMRSRLRDINDKLDQLLIKGTGSERQG